jgi:hypothetical protein
MNASQRRKLDKFQREARFMADNAADFPGNSPGDKAANLQIDVIAEIENYAAQQISGSDSSRQETSVKDDYLDDLIEMIRDINRAANAFADEVPGIEQKFRLPRTRSQQNIVSTAQSFQTDATPLKAKFIEYGLDADFLTDLHDTIDHVRNRSSQADSAQGQQTTATGGLTYAIGRGMDVSRKLDAIVKIKYRNNPAKLSAWAVASHLERAPQRGQPTAAPVV